MDTISGNQVDGRRRRRRHSDEVKAAAVTACMQAGVSIAAVAMAHGVNANLLRRWVNDAEMKLIVRAAVATPAAMPPRPRPSFVPVTVSAPIPPPAHVPTQDIQIELRSNAMTVTVTWPTGAATECAKWVRELLR